MSLHSLPRSTGRALCHSREIRCTCGSILRPSRGDGRLGIHRNHIYRHRRDFESVLAKLIPSLEG